MKEELVAEAKRLEAAGAALLNFTNSGPVVGAAVAEAVSIPVLGGFGGGPWLDGRIRMAHAAIGYAASAIDDPPDTYANVAQITLDAITAYADDVRAARQIKGGIRA
jgi:3-methyl-2-oxobutanoate hydroxymethyltransferase